MELNDLFTGLIEEFPCLWKPQDTWFRDDVQRAEAYKHLLDKYNSRAESPVDMVTLKLWVAALYNKIKIGRVRKEVCANCIAQSKDIAELLLDFPCLWDFQDLNYKEEDVRKHCSNRLMNEYNKQKYVEKVNLVSLKVKLGLFNQIRLQCSCWKKKASNKPKEQVNDTEWRAMVLQYIHLWDNELNHIVDNFALKVQAREQLMDKYKAIFGVSLEATELDHRLMKLHSELRQKVKKPSKAQHTVPFHAERQEPLPALTDPQNSSEPTETLSNDQEQNDGYNDSDYNINDTEDVKSDIMSVTETEFIKPNVNAYVITDEGKRRVYIDLNSLPLRSCDDDTNNVDDSEICTQNIKPLPLTAVDKVIINDENTGIKITTVKNKNNGSAFEKIPDVPQPVYEVQIIETQPNKDAQSRESGRKKNSHHNSFNELVREFPCLWDPEDLNSGDRGIMARSREQLLAQYNERFRNPITMVELKRKLKNLKQWQRRVGTIAIRTSSKPPPSMEELIQEFPCLWDLGDINFTNLTIKARAREKLLEKYNSLSTVPIDMDKLKQRIKNIHQRRLRLREESNIEEATVRTEELVQEFPGLWDSEDLKFTDRTIKARAREQLLDNAQSREMQRKKYLRHHSFGEMVREFPCLCDPEDLNSGDLALRARSREQLLAQYNARSRNPITMVDLKRKLRSFKQWQRRVGTIGTQSTQSKPRPRIERLVQEFPCLWDLGDINYNDRTIKARAREQLLEKYNSLSTVPIDMDKLKQKLKNMYQRRYRSREESDIEEAPKRSVRMKELIQEFPCLWDFGDINFNDRTIKAHAREQLLEKYNALSSVPIDMDKLKQKLKNIHQQRSRSREESDIEEVPKRSVRMKELIQEFPCLWDFGDINFNDRTIKARAREQLLEKYNALSSVPIDMDKLKQKLKNIHQQRSRSREESNIVVAPKATVRMEELVQEFPCLWDHKDLNYYDYTLKARARKQLLEKYNSLSSVPIDMAGLLRKLKAVYIRRYRQNRVMRGIKSWDRMAELLEEFPCLWDPKDMNYLDNTLKARAREQLLEKYNAVSSVPIDMARLRRKLRNVYNQRYRVESKNVEAPRARVQMEELVQEFPCLWDPEDLNFTDFKIKAHAREQLLEKYNYLSTVPIDMDKLKQKLKNMHQNQRRLRSRRGEITRYDKKSYELMIELTKEFPCLWDRGDVNFNDVTTRHRARRQLLAKYNAASDAPINMKQLIRKLQVLSVWRQRKLSTQTMKKRRELAKTAPARGSQSDVIAYLHAINSQNTSLNQTNDTNESRGSLDSTEPLTPGPSEEVVDAATLNEPQEPINQTPQCRVCGVLDENCINVTNDKPYITDNTTTLTLNELSVQIHFNTKKTICQNCDTKLKEIFDFVTLVKKAHDDLTVASDVKTEVNESLICDDTNTNILDDIDVYATEINCDDEIDLKDLDLDSVSVTDTEFIRQTVNAYLEKAREVEIPRQRKKRTVYVDLNSCSLSFGNRNDGNDDEMKFRPEIDLLANTESDDTKETLFADKSTGVFIEVLKRASNNGKSAEAININRPDVQMADDSDDRIRKKAKLK